ncbi:LOW QUALITY PROTEIN: adhesion G-protein coupled receptor F3 [Sarcophilus harrisii]
MASRSSGKHVKVSGCPQAGTCAHSPVRVPAGRYVCRFVSRGFQWELHQVVKVPLQADDVLGHPRQLSISCNAFSAFQLRCCIPSTDLNYTASWSPQNLSNTTGVRGCGAAGGIVSSLTLTVSIEGALKKPIVSHAQLETSGTQCLTLAVSSCPEGDTKYICKLQSLGLDPVSIPVTISIIQECNVFFPSDGDTTCPQDSLGGNWNATKAGLVARIPCPENRTGVLERRCGARGIWGPISSSCTDVRLLAMLRSAQVKLLKHFLWGRTFVLSQVHLLSQDGGTVQGGGARDLDSLFQSPYPKALAQCFLSLPLSFQLLLAGQGQPARKVPRLMAQLREQVAVVSSPSDLLALLGTVKILAQVVTRSGTALYHQTLEVSILSGVTGKGRKRGPCKAAQGMPSSGLSSREMLSPTRANLCLGWLQDFLVATNDLLELDPSSLWAPAQAQEPSMSSAVLQAVESLGGSLCSNDHPFHLTLPNVQLQTHLLGPMTPKDYSVSFSTHPPLRAKIPRHALAQLAWETGHVSITSLVLNKLGRILPRNYGQGMRDLLYAPPDLVLSNSIKDGNQTVTKVEIIMDFGGTEGTPTCVFWDHSLFQGVGAWSGEGCEAGAGDPSSTTRCICVHLTSFSVLMSPRSVPDSPTLTLLSQVGLGASIAALLLCLGTYRVVWRVVVRNKISYFRHVALLNVVLCLLAADACFLGTSLLSLGPPSPLCPAVAFLCHFFYLAAFFWMLGQALVLAHQLLFVFHQLSKHHVLPIMFTLGYLCPLGFAGATLGLYLPRGQYLREDACWLDGKGGALYTFVGPVLAIVGVNGLVLAMAVVKMLRPSLSEGPQTERRQALLGVIKALFILIPIFGLTWVLGLATLMDGGNKIPHYLFTVLNTSQVSEKVLVVLIVLDYLVVIPS